MKKYKLGKVLINALKEAKTHHEGKINLRSTTKHLKTSINELADKAHSDAKSLGWYKKGKTKSDLESIMMVVTELSEAVEELRSHGPDKIYYNKDSNGNNKPEGFSVEIADAIIRLLDLCAYKKINIEKIILEKLKYNLTRGKRHGNKPF